MKSRVLRYFLLLTLIFGLFGPVLSLAQPSEEETLKLQKQLEAIQQEIKQYEQELNSVRSEKNTLSRKINQLRLEYNKIAAQIEEVSLNLLNIETKMVMTENEIKLKEESLSELSQNLGGFLRAMDKRDHYSWLEIIISHQDIGGFFAEVQEYRRIVDGLETVIASLKTEQSALIEEQERLFEQKESQANFLSIASLQRQQLSSSLAERNTLLQKTKSEESNYQAILSDKQKLAAEIKSRIYDLLGLSEEITFGQAVSIAQWAEAQTGVRAAFLLAILTQESNLGRNVGTCNRPGDPPEKSWKVIMKPTRDQEPFKQITEELGMNPDITPVSCPMFRNGEQLGWGGAMGPAQFIPSTWIAYKGKVAAITGSLANPWDIRDAFLAAALLLKDNGALNSEWAAAMRYFSGSTNPAYSFYGDNVVATTEKYQEDIDALNY